MEKITCDFILSEMQTWVENKQVFSPSIFVDACSKLSILVGDETDKLFDLQQKVAEMKKNKIENSYPVSKANVYVQATDEYKEMKKQEAKINRIFEMIKISKLRARLLMDEIKN